MTKLLHTLFGHQWVNVVDVVKESWLVVDCLQYSEIALFSGDIHQCTPGSLVSGRETSSSTTLCKPPIQLAPGLHYPLATSRCSVCWKQMQWLMQIMCQYWVQYPVRGTQQKYQTILMKIPHI